MAKLKLNDLERKLEQALCQILAPRIGMSVESIEEIITRPKNKWLCGGIGTALLARQSPDEYIARVQIILPCPNCQAHGATFRLCHSCRIGFQTIQGIEPSMVPDEFHRDVGEDPIEVLGWEW